MADESFGEKSELPTDRRRTEVRERGNVVRSLDLTVAVLVLAATCQLYFFGPDLVTSLGDLMRGNLSDPLWKEMDQRGASRQISKVTVETLLMLWPWFALMVGAAILVNLAQVGFLYSPQAIQPQFSRINPQEGVKRLFSLTALVKLANSMLKLIVLGYIAWLCVTGSLVRLWSASDLPPSESARLVGGQMVSLGFYFSLALLILAILDYGAQYWKFEQDLLMTREEVREEMKEMDGDPHIRQRRREAHRKLAEAKQLQGVKTADAIITNPTELAVAIKYDEKKMAAPIVVAKGADFMAARIRQLAAEHRIPIIERKPLARALYRDVKVGHPVPVELYQAVAEILAYVYRLSGKGSPKRS